MLKIFKMEYFNLFHGMIYQIINIVDFLCGIYLIPIIQILNMFKLQIKMIQASQKLIDIKYVLKQHRKINKYIIEYLDFQSKKVLLLLLTKEEIKYKKNQYLQKVLLFIQGNVLFIIHSKLLESKIYYLYYSY